MSGIKELILAAEDLVYEDVEVPEWGVTVRVRGLSGTDRDAYEAKAVALRKGGQDIELRLADFRSRLLVKVLCDPKTGDRIFGESEVKALGAKSGLVIERLFEYAQRLSGMDKDAVEAARGNSGTAPRGGSTSG